MTFEEKLDRAKTGSRSAYESLCLGSLDKLYTSALISLKNEITARNAVAAAINDGYTGISRIRDERHLRSWLAHELTKNAVDKLKELKAEGVSYTASGVFADAGKLSDVDRLVFSIYAAFGYGTREISILTGMSEETVAEKLALAETKLGASYKTICAAAASNTAPAALRDKYTGFDLSIARIEAQSRPAPAAPEKKTEPEVQEQLPEPQPVPDQPAPEPEPEPQPVPSEEPPAPEMTGNDEDEAVFTDESAEDEADDDYEDYDEYEEPESEPAQEERPPESKMALNAETFIAVVSAERMKGSEFLRLIGNTRISNSAYREIEQNPRLTKKRLIELLEQSPLTENDYYKLLTAVRNRREVIELREENRRAHEMAGLYDGSKRGKYRRKRREKPRSELEMAIGIGEKKQVQPLIFEKSKVEEDDTDFQLKNSTGRFSEKNVSEERGSRRSSLEAAVSSASPESDPMSHSSLHKLFGEYAEDPVDPFAAIAANETGKQVKPDRLDEQRDEWIQNARIQEREDDILPDTSVTIEFSSEPSAPVSDTRQFDKPDLVWGGDEPSETEDTPPADDDAPAGEEDRMGAAAEEKASEDGDVTPEQTQYEAYDPCTEDAGEDEITTLPVQDGVSVTQIIRDYAVGETVTDEEADIAAELDDFGAKQEPAPVIPDKKPAEPEPVPSSGQTGYTPEFDLVFSGETGSFELDAAEELRYAEDDDIPRDEPEDIPEPPREPIRSEQRRAGHDEPDSDDDYGIGIEDDEDDDSFDRAPGHRRYKGNEYFVDDNEYYDGVNRGKIITCAVLALLLAAGSAGMKLLPAGNEEAVPALNETSVTDDSTLTSAEDEQPQETASEASDEDFDEKVTLTKLSSYADMTDSRYSGSTRSGTNPGQDGYLRASGEPFPTDIVKEPSQCAAVYSGDTAYIYSRTENSFISVYTGDNSADGDTDTDTDNSVAPDTSARLQLPSEDLHAFTAADGELYIVCDGFNESEQSYNTSETRVIVCDSTLAQKAVYTIGGSYAGSGIMDGKLVVAAAFRPDKAEEFAATGVYASEHPYVSSDGELHELDASDIFAAEGTEHNCVHVLYEVGSGRTAAFLGGCSDGYSSPEHLKFSDSGITVVTSDDGATYAANVSSDFTVTDAVRYKGDAFSANSVGNGGLIGQLPAPDNGLTAYKNGKLITVPGVTAESVAWSESGVAYVVAAQSDGRKMLYGIDMSGAAPESAPITASDIYTDKLIKAGSFLVGLKAEPAPDGERAGLRFSLYEYDGALKETAYSIIELDKDTPRENLRYLSSPAEQDITLIAADETATLFGIPTVYFDGYSEVERVVFLRYDGTTFALENEIITYDAKSSVLIPLIRGERLDAISE